MRTGVCNPRFLRVASTWSPSRPGSMRSKMTRSNSSAFTRKNPSSPVGATTTSYFSRSNPSRSARATFASSSTTRMRNWLFPSCILVRSSISSLLRYKSTLLRHGPNALEPPGRSGPHSSFLCQNIRLSGRPVPRVSSREAGSGPHPSVEKR